MKKYFLAICLISSPAMAANQFNLICDGVERYHNTPRHIVYRVDLDGNRFCVEDSFRMDHTCQVRDIVNVTESTISFYDNAIHDTGNGYYIEKVSRIDGKATITDGHSDYSGMCAVAPFTGLPEKKF